jgi:hypothetical protein
MGCSEINGISINGIKNSLSKEKNDHVFFGIKNILNNSNESYNDLIFKNIL